MPAEAMRTLREVNAVRTARQNARDRLRSAIVWCLAATTRRAKASAWIRFPYYHHVFDDERKSFVRQLRYMRDRGEFLSLDDAVGLLESDRPLGGRFFCISFDDGFRNCHTNAVPILLDHGAPAAFFVPTSFIGTSIPADLERIRGFYGWPKTLIEFLTWHEVREMAWAGMTIGSHTVNHRALSALSDEEVERELRASKQVIEREVGAPCLHFCAPRGRPGIDFDPQRDPEIAERLGYRSFLTTARGSALRRTQPMALERDHLIADWGLYQLRYFLER